MQNRGLSEKKHSEMAGSQTAGRERVPEGEGRSKGRSGQQPQIRWLGGGCKCRNEGEMVPGSQGDLHRTAWVEVDIGDDKRAAETAKFRSHFRSLAVSERN